MRSVFTALLLVLTTNLLFSQTTITLKVKQSFGTKAKLYQFEGKQRVKIDSCSLNPNGNYEFILPANAPQGQYRMQIGKSGSINFLVANEPEIVLESVVYAIEDSLKIIKSDENKIFLNYLRKKHDKEQKKWFIESLLNYYPDSSKLAQLLNEELYTIETRFNSEAAELAKIDTNLLVSSYINLDMVPFVGIATNCQLKNKKADLWWNGVDLKKQSLLNTPLLEKNLWEFIECLQCDDVYDKEQQDSVFISRISQLLNKPMCAQIRRLIIGSLCFGFSETDYYSVIEYLAENGAQYAEPITSDNEVMKRVELEKGIKIGNKALDFSFNPINSENKTKLSAVTEQYTLLLFWSAWCPHCVEMLPKLRQLYNQYKSKGFEIIAISVDVDDQALVSFVEDQNLPWINTAFTRKNEEKLSNSFNVDGTPKMILVDKNLRIVSKPTSVKQLQNKLLKLPFVNQ